ncbi:MAG: peptidylprolyl isomerase [Proteobacteria bacterium]|nr:peptidylprolyl isomerase [Pseudomonadota bacterium]
MLKKTAFLLLISSTYCSSNTPTIEKDTLAAINNRTITANDFATQGQSIGTAPGVNLHNRDGRINVLKDMVNEELVFQDAIKNNYHLKNLHIKHEVVKEYLKEKFGVNLPKVTDKQITDYFEANKTDIEMVRASHILITPKNKDDKASVEQAKTRANQIRSDITSGKISFADAAKKYSEDPGSASQAGDLDYFQWARMTPKFATAAFSLKKVGDISPVVETDFGMHIIQLTGERRGIDQYKDKIRWKLYQENIQPLIDKYFDELKTNAKIQIFNDKLMDVNIPAAQ